MVSVQVEEEQEESDLILDHLLDLLDQAAQEGLVLLLGLQCSMQVVELVEMSLPALVILVELVEEEDPTLTLMEQLEPQTLAVAVVEAVMEELLIKVVEQEALELLLLDIQLGGVYKK